MGNEVRVRFAPSPTGYMHVGNARAAIFNWLFARHEGGTFVLRIEDTDRERSTEQAVEVILDGLRWLGVDWDEGPIFQSERLDLYREAADRLVAEGKAYRCYCTTEELEARRAEGRKGKATGYDGRCRSRTAPREGVPPVIRLRTPDEGATAFDDIVQGRIETPNEEIDDRVILRSDGTPTYNLSVVVDDHAMGITHIVRGADHLTNTPVQVLLYGAFGWPMPRFAHLPLILGPDRSKLSKRHGSVKVTDYRDEGILPEALWNALLRLGWSHGDQEIFARDEVVPLFELSKVSRSPSIFDFDKLRNLFSHHFVRAAEPSRLAALVVEHLGRIGLEVAADDPRLALLLPALTERARTLVELAEQARPFLSDDVAVDEAAAKKHLKPEAAPLLADLADRIERLPAGADGPAIMACFEAAAEAGGVKLGKVAQPARVLMLGTDRSPGIDLVVRVLGLPRAVARIRDGASRLAAAS